ncbi:MAG: hypothetical protein JXQ73_09750 [Phycisphaerae bacterium]|nr:hypothetical protein [Phycisphaerae bacterium]
MGFDLFYAWRYMLGVVCTIYAAVRLGQSLWRWQQYLWSGQRSTTLMRHYLVAQLVSVRVHRFTLELAQIAALLAMFGLITWAHRYV